MMNRRFNGYYIQTGAKNVMFTLRQTVTKQSGGMVLNGVFTGETYEVSEYIQTLAGNITDAINKAEEITGFRLDDPFITTFNRGVRQEKPKLDPSLIHVGRYKGGTVECMVEDDLEYTMWFIETFTGQPECVELIERIKSTNAVKTEFKRIEDERVSNEQLMVQTEENARLECAKSQFVGTVGDRIEVTATVDDLVYGSGAFGGWTLTIMTDPDGNRLTYFNSIKLKNEDRDNPEAEKGETIKFVATVKNHETRSDYDLGYPMKQTMFSRATKGELINETPIV